MVWMNGIEKNWVIIKQNFCLCSSIILLSIFKNLSPIVAPFKARATDNGAFEIDMPMLQLAIATFFQNKLFVPLFRVLKKSFCPTVSFVLSDTIIEFY